MPLPRKLLSPPPTSCWPPTAPGGNLETLVEGHDKATYSSGTNGTYLDDNVTNWLFDDARVSGDSTVINNGASNYYVLVFRDRYREEYATVDVRHILVSLGEATLSSTDEGYEEEQAQLKADAKAQAEALLEEWKAGRCHRGVLCRTGHGALR